MKGSIVGLLVLLSVFTADSDVLRWERSLPLQSSDFLGEVPRFSTTAAMTYSRIHTSAKFPDRAHVIYTVHAEFDRQKSWMRPSSVDDKRLLGHEQLHFDITEYHARLLRRALSRPTAHADIRPRTTFLRDSIWQECAKWQQKYDDQTSHGTDEEEQYRWNAVIAKCISGLNAFEDPTVTVAIISSPSDSMGADPRLK